MVTTSIELMSCAGRSIGIGTAQLGLHVRQVCVLRYQRMGDLMDLYQIRHDKSVTVVTSPIFEVLFFILGERDHKRPYINRYAPNSWGG